MVRLEVEALGGPVEEGGDGADTTTVFGSPRDVTLDEIAIETFFPADPATAATLRAAVGRITPATAPC